MLERIGPVKKHGQILTKNVTLFAVACIMYMVVIYIMYGGDIFLLRSGSGAVEGGGKRYPCASADFCFFQVSSPQRCPSYPVRSLSEWLCIPRLCGCQPFHLSNGCWMGGNPVFGMYTLVGFSLLGSGICTWRVQRQWPVSFCWARKGKYGPNGEVNAIPGANLPLATLGTFILWLGWFGFNGGSVLATASVDSANAVAVVFMNTNLAAAGGCIGALIVAKLLFGKADLTMALNGCLAGLVAITAGPDTPSALQATIFGALGGVLVVFSITTLDKLKIDDPVGAISVHGVVGLLGLLLVPVTNDGSSFSGQIIGALTIFGWVFVASFIAFFVIKLVLGLRVSEEEEYEGVDVSECGMEAYPEFAGAK